MTDLSSGPVRDSLRYGCGDTPIGGVLAVAIPRHRVIKADGTIAGYRSGVARKRRLLRLAAA